MRDLTKRYIVGSISNLNLSAPIRYERYYINNNLRAQRKGNIYQKEILSDDNTVLEKQTLTPEEFSTLKAQAYSEIIRDSYLYLDNSRISIKKYYGKYEGLCRVEVSFDSVEEKNAFQKASWMGEEITSSPLAFDKDLSKLSAAEFEENMRKYLI